MDRRFFLFSIKLDKRCWCFAISIQAEYNDSQNQHWNDCGLHTTIKERKRIVESLLFESCCINSSNRSIRMDLLMRYKTMLNDQSEYKYVVLS